MSKNIAQELVILRAKNGWTQQQLADNLETTQRTVAAWESGNSIPRKTMQVRIAKVFELPENYFFDETSSESDALEKIAEDLVFVENLDQFPQEEQLKIIKKVLIQQIRK